MRVTSAPCHCVVYGPSIEKSSSTFTDPQLGWNLKLTHATSPPGLPPAFKALKRHSADGVQHDQAGVLTFWLEIKEPPRLIWADLQDMNVLAHSSRTAVSVESWKTLVAQTPTERHHQRNDEGVRPKVFWIVIISCSRVFFLGFVFSSSFWRFFFSSSPLLFWDLSSRLLVVRRFFFSSSGLLLFLTSQSELWNTPLHPQSRHSQAYRQQY